VKYSFNTVSSAGQLSFNISQSDLDAHNCISLLGTGQASWECYFELAFVVKNVTQVSYYFSIEVVVNTNVSSLNPPAVNFVPIIDI
jgi:hypothetical protein